MIIMMMMMMMMMRYDTRVVRDAVRHLCVERRLETVSSDGGSIHVAWA